MSDGLIAIANSIQTYVVDSELAFKDIGLDWLSFTFLPEIDYSLVITDPLYPSGRKKLPIDLFFDLFGDRFEAFVRAYGVWSDKGKHYYSRCISVKCPANNDLKLKGYTTDFQILYCMPDDGANTDYAYKMGVNVSIPSHFLRAFFKLIGFDFDNLKNFFIWSKNNSIKFSRIDICWDDFSKTYTPHDYALDWHMGNIVSHYQKHEWYESSHTCGGTFALGSRDTKYMRIYDKDFESKGAIPAIRYEFMYTGKWARSLAELICVNDLYIDFKALIMDWFKVVGSPMTFNAYSDKSACPIRSEWVDFLKRNFSEKLQVLKIRPKSTKDIKRLNMNFVYTQMRWYYTFVSLFGQDLANTQIDLIRGKPDNFTPSLVNFFNSIVVSNDDFVDNFSR